MATNFDLIHFVGSSLVAACFMTAGAIKAYDRHFFENALSKFGFQGKIPSFLSNFLPIWELILAILFLVDKTSFIGGIAIVSTLSVFTVFLTSHLIKGNKFTCNCFGNFYQKPATWMAVVRNMTLAGVSVLIIWYDNKFDIGQQFATFPTSVALAEGWLLWVAFNKLKEKKSRIQLFGEKVKAPEFNLLATNGNTVSLKGLIQIGNPVLLVFLDPACGPCEVLMPYLAAWEKELSHSLTIQLIGNRSLEENRVKAARYGISQIAVQNGQEVSNSYKISGTPGAVLITPQGDLATGGINGADDIIRFVTGAEKNPEKEIPSPAGENADLFLNDIKIGQLLPKIWLRDEKGYSIDILGQEKQHSFILFRDENGIEPESFWTDFDFEITKFSARPKTILVLAAPLAGSCSYRFDSVAVDSSHSARKALGIKTLPAAVFLDRKGKLKLPVAQSSHEIINLLRMVRFLQSHPESTIQFQN